MRVLRRGAIRSQCGTLHSEARIVLFLAGVRGSLTLSRGAIRGQRGALHSEAYLVVAGDQFIDVLLT